VTRGVASFLSVALLSACLSACQDGGSTTGAPATGSASTASSGDADHVPAGLDVVAPKVGLDGSMPIVQASYSSLMAVFSDDTADGRIKSQTNMVRVSLSDVPMAPGQPMKP